MSEVTGNNIMSRMAAIIENLPINAVRHNSFRGNVVAHPARASMAQKLAGKGELVFEGELLELPLNWHPTGTRH